MRLLDGYDYKWKNVEVIEVLPEGLVKISVEDKEFPRIVSVSQLQVPHASYSCDFNKGQRVIYDRE